MSTKHEPYSTMALVAVGICLTCVPITTLLGHRRLAVLELAALILALAIIRLMRPDGTWIAARSRAFDVIFGLGLAIALFIYSAYANLPRIL